jgi:hypothetical protein
MKTYKTDYEIGVKSEDLLYEPLKEFFKTDLKRTKYKFSKYDFYDKEHTYELKTRDCKLHSYTTTLITEDKIIPTNKKQIFIFNFDDAIAFIEYDEEAFKKYNVDLYRRNKRDCDDKYKNHIYIDVKDLTIIKLKPRKCMINIADLLKV